jgi:hypothetical protein
MIAPTAVTTPFRIKSLSMGSPDFRRLYAMVASIGP